MSPPVLLTALLGPTQSLGPEFKVLNRIHTTSYTTVNDQDKNTLPKSKSTIPLLVTGPYADKRKALTRKPLSRAAVLKESATFRNKVTVYRAYSLSSVSFLEDLGTFQQQHVTQLEPTNTQGSESPEYQTSKSTHFLEGIIHISSQR